MLTFCGVHTWHTWHLHILWLYIHFKGIPVAPTSIALFYIHWPLLYTYKAPLAPTQVSDTGRRTLQSIKEDEIYIMFYKRSKLVQKIVRADPEQQFVKSARKKYPEQKFWESVKKIPEQLNAKFAQNDPKGLFGIFPKNIRMDNLQSLLQMNPKWQFTIFLKTWSYILLLWFFILTLYFPFHRFAQMKYTSSHQEHIIAKYYSNDNLSNLQQKNIWNENLKDSSWTKKGQRAGYQLLS